MPKIVKKVPVEVQNRSGFNASHKSSFSAKCGTITPILVDHIMPNTTINLDVACEVNLPPAISDFYGDIEARIEFFFVPYRVIWAGYKYFFVQPPQGGNNLIPGNQPANIQINFVPGATTDLGMPLIVPGSLSDMLGYKFNPAVIDNVGQSIRLPNILPYVAYQKIYDDFYRDSRITAPVFIPPQNGQVATTTTWKSLPWILANGGESQYAFDLDSTDELFQLRQRCWDKDYFTNATTAPQSGDASYLEFSVYDNNTDESGAFEDADLRGSFSISSLRVANSLQRFAEVNNLAGLRMADQQYARFGCYPSDAALDRPIYLGQKRFNVYKRSVYQQTENTSNPNSNPFSGILGNKTSALSGYGEGFMGKFHAKDAGLLFVNFTLVPKAVYSTGVRRYLSYTKLSDFPEPLLQGTGDQPIYKSELVGATSFGAGQKEVTFGYTQRYSEAKFMNDEVHGLLRDEDNLSMFQLQRSFDRFADVDLSTEFLEIPQDYLDQITTADQSISKYGCWSQCFFDYKKVQPLAAYSLPTLGDPKDTHTVIINNGGKRL